MNNQKRVIALAALETCSVAMKVTEKAFCPTGEGGGVDPSCSGDEGGGGSSGGITGAALTIDSDKQDDIDKDPMTMLDVLPDAAEGVETPKDSEAAEKDLKRSLASIADKAGDWITEAAKKVTDEVWDAGSALMSATLDWAKTAVTEEMTRVFRKKRLAVLYLAIKTSVAIMGAMGGAMFAGAPIAGGALAVSTTLLYQMGTKALKDLVGD